MRFLFILAFALRLSAADPFAITNPVISQAEDGPALPGSTDVMPGDILFLSFQIEGYRVSPEKKVRISYKVDATDPAGTRVLETIESVVDAELSPQDKDWKPKARQQIFVPPVAPSGKYKIAISAKDDLTGANAVKQIEFNVQGHKVEPSGTLAVRNFHFYRTEDDPSPISPPAYRPGDTLWARFDMTGYKFGPKNEVKVGYGVAVLNPAGKQIFSQPEAANEDSFSFYPKRYVAAGMNLNLQPNMNKGEYTILVTVRDTIGGQQIEHREKFSVE